MIRLFFWTIVLISKKHKRYCYLLENYSLNPKSKVIVIC